MWTMSATFTSVTYVPRRGRISTRILEREALDRLAQRRAPDLELAHERVLDQCGSGRKAQGDDLVAESEVGPIGDRRAVARAG